MASPPEIGFELLPDFEHALPTDFERLLIANDGSAASQRNTHPVEIILQTSHDGKVNKRRKKPAVWFLSEDGTAAARALAIPELLEQVLLQVSLRDTTGRWLFKVKVVNHTWRNVVETSLRLRKATFMEQDGEAVKMIQSIDDEEYEVGYTLSHHIPLFGFTEFQVAAPLRSRERVYDEGWQEHGGLQASGFLLCHTLGWTSELVAQARVTPSMREMFVTSPPVTALLLEPSSCDAYEEDCAATAYDPKGIRFGLVLDIIDKILKDMDGPDWLSYGGVCMRSRYQTMSVEKREYAIEDDGGCADLDEAKWEELFDWSLMMEQ